MSEVRKSECYLSGNGVMQIDYTEEGFPVASFQPIYPVRNIKIDFPPVNQGLMETANRIIEEMGKPCYAWERTYEGLRFTRRI